MAFRLRADAGQLMLVFGSSLSSSIKKRSQSCPPLKTLSGSTHGVRVYARVCARVRARVCVCVCVLFVYVSTSLLVF